MQQLLIKAPKTHLDGAVVAVTVNLGTLKPVVVTAVTFPASQCRIVICDSRQLQQQLINTYYQMMQPAPAGVLLEVASSCIWKSFYFDKPAPKPDHLTYFRHPQVWAPVTLQSPTGQLYVMVEARGGNKKRKATLEAVLHIQ